MTHGIYDVIRSNAHGNTLRHSDDQHNGKKLALRLELIESQACWYELLFNSSERAARQVLIDQLRTMQAKAAPTSVARGHGESDYCILCFLGARTRTRFCTSKPPRFSLFGNDFVFYVETGKNCVRKKLSTTFVDSRSGHAIRPEIDMDENFISIAFSGDEQERVSVHDFLRKCGLELQINTTLYAVEYISHPTERWLEGADRSLTQMLYEVSNEEHDFFFYSNLFKVTLMQLEQDAYISRGGRDFSEKGENALTVQQRGALIEKAFNTYFQLPALHLQDLRHAPVPQSEAASQNIQVLMELTNPHELYRFGSEQVQPADKHMFTCDIVGDEVTLSVLE